MDTAYSFPWLLFDFEALPLFSKGGLGDVFLEGFVESCGKGFVGHLFGIVDDVLDFGGGPGFIQLAVPRLTGSQKEG